MDTTERLNLLILHIPGVVALFAPDPAWRQTPGRTRPLPGTSAPATAILGRRGGAVTVHVRISVDSAFPAPETARRVAAAIRQDLSPAPALLLDPINITVQIALISAVDRPHSANVSTSE